ncbi:unnamed protein product [Chondrus crispus]|uniref:Uncharacterized protein n=1 Tax=Chondrus crispus TaxID=2769 RepID=R7Q7N1_CHOCR|nr:unnamed protein product [Chondrus crispus]CDF34537.1 unnamed protein product [Chondrus crispus]|eukprot:XP_005714356.1 unnamed protein product [Chondrus crispus]
MAETRTAFPRPRTIHTHPSHHGQPSGNCRCPEHCCNEKEQDYRPSSALLTRTHPSRPYTTPPCTIQSDAGRHVYKAPTTYAVQPYEDRASPWVAYAPSRGSRPCRRRVIGTLLVLTATKPDRS